MWQDHIWLANHPVPINAGQLRRIQTFYFPNPLDLPKHFPFELVLAVDSVNKATMDPPHGLQRLSPAEPCHAMLFQLQQAIKQKAPDSTLQMWKKLLLTTPTTFEMVSPGDERFWRAQNIREDQVQKGLVVQLSLRQRVFDVLGFAEAMGVSSAAKVAEAYKKVKLADSAEPISDSFVDSC